MSADLDLPDRETGLDPELETTSYRLVQEALTNVVRHAAASHARVVMRLGVEGLLIEVSDDGQGFDPDHRTEGFGVLGMRERVFLAGGEMELTSSERGTWVRARLPVRSAAASEPSGAGDAA